MTVLFDEYAWPPCEDQTCGHKEEPHYHVSLYGTGLAIPLVRQSNNGLTEHLSPPTGECGLPPRPRVTSPAPGHIAASGDQEPAAFSEGWGG